MVPTPFDCKINEVDDSAVQESLSKLADASFNNTVIIKSTLPPGFTETYSKLYDFDIAFNRSLNRKSIFIPKIVNNNHTPNAGFPASTLTLTQK